MLLNVYVRPLNYLKVFGVDSRIKSSEKEKEKEEIEIIRGSGCRRLQFSWVPRNRWPHHMAPHLCKILYTCTTPGTHDPSPREREADGWMLWMKTCLRFVSRHTRPWSKRTWGGWMTVVDEDLPSLRLPAHTTLVQENLRRMDECSGWRPASLRLSLTLLLLLREPIRRARRVAASTDLDLPLVHRNLVAMVRLSLQFHFISNTNVCNIELADRRIEMLLKWNPGMSVLSYCVWS